MKILMPKDSISGIRKYLIPKDNQHSFYWVEVTVDNVNFIFTAKRVAEDEIDKNYWIDAKDYAFPSVLLNEFIRGF